MKKFFEDFKKFAVKGNVIDMAVAVMIGAAFGKIVTSVVEDIVMPIIGILIGGVDFTALTLELGDATIKYGSFLQNCLNFFIIAFTMFLVIRLVSKLPQKKKEEAPPKKSAEEELLEKILKAVEKISGTDDEVTPEMNDSSDADEQDVL